MERTIRISETDLDRLKLSYDRLNFHVATLQAMEKRNWIYEKMIKHFADEGITHKHDYYLHQLNSEKNKVNHSRFRNWINEVWWSDGINRTKAVLNSVFLFILFFICNLIFYKKLRLVYMPDTFQEYHVRIKHKYIRHKPNKLILFFSNLLGTFIYTSYVFWGLRLDLTSLRIRYLPLFVLIILQYLVGLVCVAYIISFIIVK